MCLAGLDHVLYCDIESNIRDADMSAESLQRLPVSISLKPARNGIAYLTRNIEIECYHSAYLSDLDAVLTGCSDWTRQRHKQKAASRLYDDYRPYRNQSASDAALKVRSESESG